MLTAQPFHYIHPQWNVAASLLSGAELVILEGFHPSLFWAKVREHRVTYFYCLGAMPALLRMPPRPADRDHAVRAVQCSAIPPALHRTLEERQPRQHRWHRGPGHVRRRPVPVRPRRRRPCRIAGSATRRHDMWRLG
jgi:hypothetical protein